MKKLNEKELREKIAAIDFGVKEIVKKIQKDVRKGMRKK